MKRMNISKVKRILRNIHSTEYAEQEKKDAIRFLCTTLNHNDYRRLSKYDLYVALNYVVDCLGK